MNRDDNVKGEKNKTMVDDEAMMQIGPKETTVKIHVRSNQFIN